MQLADHRCINDQVLVSKALSSDSEIRCFERVDGNIVIIAWLKRSESGARPPAASLMDERREIVELTLPCSATTANIYDEAGMFRRREPLTPHPGGTRVRLTLRGGNVSVVEVTSQPHITHFVWARAARRPTPSVRSDERQKAPLHSASRRV